MARQEHLQGSLYSPTKRLYSHCEVVKRSDDQEGFELLLRSWVFSGTIYLFFRDVSFMSLVHNLVWLTEIILLVIALLYRYHSASSPLQRQQTKWVIFGTCVAGTIVVGLRIPTLLFPSLWQTGSFYRLLSGLPIS